MMWVGPIHVQCWVLSRNDFISSGIVHDGRSHPCALGSGIKSAQHVPITTSAANGLRTYEREESLNESEVTALFDQLEKLHAARRLTPFESDRRNAAITRGCANFWPRREAEPPRLRTWSLSTCARTPGCIEVSCLWLPAGNPLA